MSGYKKVFVTPIDGAPRDPSYEQVDQLGDIRMEANKTYKYVKLAASQTADVNFAANGDMVVYSDYDAHLVCADITDNEGKMPAGIICNFDNWDGDFSAAVSKYMWIQIRGPATLSQTVGNSAAAGNEIACSGSGAADLTFTLATTVISRAGVLINATTKTVYLNCPD